MNANKNLKFIAGIDDLHKIAKKRLPKMLMDYIDGGSFGQQTVFENQIAFKNLRLREKAFIDVSTRSLETTILGQKFAVPFGYGPIGLSGMFWPDGEILAAQVAEKVNMPFCLSTMSICSMEQIKEHTNRPFWQQLYFLKNREFVKSLVERAKLAGCSALFVNADLAIGGVRYCDISNGLTAPLQLTFKNIYDVLKHQSWFWSYLFCKNKSFGNLAGHVQTLSDNMVPFTAYMNSQFDQSVTWKDIEWLRSVWSGKLVIKGILDVEDAIIAKEIGADGIVVSNHGGRQQDGVTPSIQMLPKIVAAIDGGLEILFDSGARSGQDILRALALGANFVLIGRPFTYGLAAYGSAGVEKVFTMLRNELDIAMVLSGIKSIPEIDSKIIID